jgi:hypothetical protein
VGGTAINTRLIARTTAGIGPAMTGATSRGAGVVPANIRGDAI